MNRKVYARILTNKKFLINVIGEQIRFSFFFENHIASRICQELSRILYKIVIFGIRNLNKYFVKIVHENVLKKHFITIKKYITL